MATIRKVKWKNAGGKVSERYQLTYIDRKGKRHRSQFATKAAAENERIKIEAEILGGTHVPESQSRTVEKAWENWLDYLYKKVALGKLERTTARHYQTHLEKHIEPHAISRKTLSKLERADVQEFVDDIESQMSHAMAHRVYATFKNLLAYSRARGWLAYNPCEGIKIERGSRYDGEPEVKIPPKEEIKRLLETAKTDITGKSTIIVRLMIFRGLRISEVRGMPKKGLELNGKASKVKITQRADEYRKIGPPKSRTSYRSLALSPEDVVAIKKWFLSAGITDKTRDDALVFGNGAGRPESYQNLINRWWIPLLTKAGLVKPFIDEKTGEQPIDPKTGKPKVITNFTPHQLRHAFASLHIERGIQPKQLQSMMGHSSIQVTMDTYGHLWKNVDEEHALAVGVEQQLG